MTEREVSSERVSEERCLEIADGLAAMSEMPVFAQGHRSILLTAAAALRSSVKTVAVKKLEWVAIEAARSDEDPRTEETGDYEATTPFGVYSIEMGFGSDEYVWSLSFDDVLVEGARGGNDPEKLMAAAQSDYERRILSALEAPTPQEAPGEVTDAMVERAHKAQMSELFLRCQPDRGDVFSFMDDRKDVMRSALTAALKGDRP